MFADLRFAARALLRRPSFTALCIALLALGIGVNTAIFSAIQRLIASPMPYADGSRLAVVWRSSADGGITLGAAPALADAWRAQNRSFEWLEAFLALTVTRTDGEPEILHASQVSPGLPSMLGVAPLLGRPLATADARVGAPAVAFLGERYWRDRYGATAAALGQTITLDGVPHTVVGVMPSRLDAYQGPEGEPVDVWRPLVLDTTQSMVNVLGRLRTGVSIGQAQADLDRVADAVPHTMPMPGRWISRVQGARELVPTALRHGLLIMWGAVGVVLLIACVNVAGLVLARTRSRHREIAVRAALGASRSRLVRTLVFESTLLALLGGAAGVLLAHWVLGVVRALRPDALRALDVVQLDWQALLITTGLALLSGLLIGFLPALALTRVDIAAAMKQGASTTTSGRSSTRVRSLLVTAQIALSVVLLVGASLLVRSVHELSRRPLGFQPEGVLSVRLAVPAARASTSEARAALYRELLDGARTLPGVREASLASGIPPRFGVRFGELTVETEGQPQRLDAMAIPVIQADAAIFRTLGIRLREGSTWDEATGRANQAVVVNAWMAQRYWPGQTAVGKRFRIGTEGEWMTVVGVVDDIAASGYAGTLGGAQIYLPDDFRSGARTLVLHAAGDEPLTLLPAVRALLTNTASDVPIRDVAPLTTLLANTMARERFFMSLLTAFSIFALTLACIGLYGLVSYSVAQRTREFGVRLALGASPSRIARTVVAQSLVLLGGGLAIGLMTALSASRLLASLLAGFSPRDPVSFAIATAVITVTAIWALVPPFLRVLAVDPVTALRTE